MLLLSFPSSCWSESRFEPQHRAVSMRLSTSSKEYEVDDYFFKTLAGGGSAFFFRLEQVRL